MYVCVWGDINGRTIRFNYMDVPRKLFHHNTHQNEHSQQKKNTPTTVSSPRYKSETQNKYAPLYVHMYQHQGEGKWRERQNGKKSNTNGKWSDAEEDT